MNRMLTIVFAALLGLAASASAATIGTLEAELGNSGWIVTGPSFYQLVLTPLAEGVDGDGTKWVSLQISKTFYFDADPVTGIFPAIELNFTQNPDVAFDDVATRIYIDAEGVFNATGSDWEDYHWTLMRHGIASFNQELTDPSSSMSDPGWSYGPFTGHSWVSDDNFDTDSLIAWGGVVPDGGSFFPGSGAGSLVIDIDNSETLPGMASFQFIQYIQNPPAPEPATLSILLVGGMVMLRRRRIA